MSEFGTIVPPRKGERITADWCRAVTDAALRGRAYPAGFGGGAGRRSEAFVSDLPFRLSHVMCAIESGGTVAEHWVICLPEGSVSDSGGALEWSKDGFVEPFGSSGNRIAPEGRCYVLPGDMERSFDEGSEIWCVVDAGARTFAIKIVQPDSGGGTEDGGESGGEVGPGGDGWGGAGRRFLVARIKGGRIEQVTLGAVFLGGRENPKPFDIVTEEDGTRKMVRCSFTALGVDVELGDYTIPEANYEDPELRIGIIMNAPSDANLNVEDLTQYLSIGTEDELPQGEEASGRTVGFFRLYELDGNRDVLIDWRDAPIRWQFWHVDDNTISVEEADDTSRNGQFHLKQFYGSERNLTEVTGVGVSCEILVRYLDGLSGSNPKLCYLTKDGLRKYLGLSGDGSGEGGDGDETFSASGGMFAWDESTRTIGAGGVMAGRKWINATGTGSGKGDGTYCVKVTFSGLNVTAEVTTGSGGTTDTECWIPIYTISGGKVSKDLRGAFAVQCWEA